MMQQIKDIIQLQILGFQNLYKKYLTEKEQEILKEEKIRLKPWDPMGTLAQKFIVDKQLRNLSMTK